ncbi:MAG: hypothetical protein ABSF33_12495 [Acidimicrobiales bacterium]
MTITEDVAQPSAESTGRKRMWVVIAAVIPVGLYLLYVFHYSVNVPYADDWYIIPLADSALHGHLGMSELWNQAGDTRLFVPKLIFVAFAFVDRLNMKSIQLFSALLFAASYVLLLSLLRSYLGRRLTFVPVFVVGIVWFSLEDVQNALWAYQLAWYLTVFFFVTMLYFLLIPRHHRTVFFGLGMLAAVAGSYSIVQGFLLWPVGLICLLWVTPWGRRAYYEAATWVAAAVVTTAIYLPGFNATSNAACFPHTSSCSLSFALSHPDLLFRWFLLLIGNLIPAPWIQLHSAPGAHQLLGAVILVVAVFVVVRSWRERQGHATPLPLLLIVFGVLFDLTIAIGRVGEGPAAALQNRFTMPNLILLVGIVVYALGHLPTLRVPTPTDWKGRLKIAGLVTLGVFLVVQSVVATDFGITNARATRQTHETDARIVVNVDRIPSAKQACELALAVWPPKSLSSVIASFDWVRRESALDRLSVFQPGPESVFRAEGPPNQQEIDAAGYLIGAEGQPCS